MLLEDNHSAHRDDDDDDDNKGDDDCAADCHVTSEQMFIIDQLLFTKLWKMYCRVKYDPDHLQEKKSKILNKKKNKFDIVEFLYKTFPLKEL